MFLNIYIFLLTCKGKSTIFNKDNRIKSRYKEEKNPAITKQKKDGEKTKINCPILLNIHRLKASINSMYYELLK